MAKKSQQSESSQVAARRGTYPYYLLKASFRLSASVKTHGGDRLAVPKAVLAEDLSMDQGGSAFAQLVASGKTYGIVEGHTELRLTELGRDYYFPTDGYSERLAELAFLQEPIAFQFLIDKFDGSQVPGQSMLANILGREFRISESWRARVAQIFISNATDLGVLDGSNCLRYASARHRAEQGGPLKPSTIEMQSNRIVTEPTNSVELPINAANITTVVSGHHGNVWQFTESGGTVRLETPDPLPRALWDRLTKYVEMLEPIKDSTEG